MVQVSGLRGSDQGRAEVLEVGEVRTVLVLEPRVTQHLRVVVCLNSVCVHHFPPYHCYVLYEERFCTGSGI